MPVRIALFVVVGLLGCAGAPSLPASGSARTDDPLREAHVALAALAERCGAGACPVRIASSTTLDTVIADASSKRVEARFSRDLGHRRWTMADARRFEALATEVIASSFPGYSAQVYAAHQRVTHLVPNAPRPIERLSNERGRTSTPPLVQREGAPEISSGLAGRHIAMWPSHGWYYEPTLDRWEWQRARVFTTVEDLLPFAFVTQYVAPMVERAGATVMMPRERDTQRHMVIVDADTPGSGYDEIGRRWDDVPVGFAYRPPVRAGENPFRLGTSRQTIANSRDLRLATWTPDLPGAGTYMVYVSYAPGANRTDQARYTVRHAGGETTFLVNQQMGAGTWVPLGAFEFEAGMSGSVELVGDGQGMVSADAVRFGGGMGDVERGGETSGRPRFVEGARYYMQFAGAPESVISPGDEPDEDYRDDYQGRAEWVNWLRASPEGGDGFGPSGHEDEPGLGIPIDLSFAFHTDAGTTSSDTTIGTLVIYNTQGMDETGTFPNGTSRLANRDLADGLMRQLVGDLRTLYDPAWTERALWDRPYSEATRAKVPSVLLELLSHHNGADMRFALDPRFRFDASRAIYKAIGRFLAGQRGETFVVQPLPVTNLAATFEGNGVRVRWAPQRDPLEPTAFPERYIVYQRAGESGWDEGTVVDATSARLPSPPVGEILSVRVSALNDGGESAPSEVLAVGRAGGDPVLVVNGFDRVAPPAYLDTGNLRGFAGWMDQGVPEGIDPAIIGDQYNLLNLDPWRDDDAPGWGASHADLETMLVRGNTRDAVVAHGQALLAAGRSFVSSSDEAVETGAISMASYGLVDLVLGEEKTTPWPSARDARARQFEALPEAMRIALAEYLDNGGSLFLSGAHWATDTAGEAGENERGVAFLEEVLGIRWRTDHAARTGGLVATSGGLLPEGASIQYVYQRGPNANAIEAPDGIEPANPEGQTVLRYAENQISAGVVAGSVAALGVPFESIRQPEARAALMRAVLDALED
ncbi:MAG: xanthan lyase [Rubricoccaceae bacterium]